MVAWLEAFERQDWISCVWGTSQDAMTSDVVVAAVLDVWYPNLVKPSLAMLCVHPLLMLVMAMNHKYSSAAEILAEGMENTWSLYIAFEIPRLPTLLGGASDTTPKTVISTLSFSPDGEGLIAFLEHGLIIR
uniref:Transducin/WD40 repeat-like superfamily protein n=1 Tax=Tanacetum cinerariifolium TaxID=118510 RepID=A0A6L2K936_TANCI|nr:transducin/WD40 repeat-like superfamily protein [Tanacetum cinerariifolium]